MHEDAEIAHIDGKCYVAHAIETYDTCCLKGMARNNVSIYYLATMVSDKTDTPRFELTCEHAKISYPAGAEERILVEIDTGEKLYYDCPNNQRFTYYRDVFDGIRNNRQLVCDGNTVIPDLKLADFITENIEVVPFSKDVICETEETIEIQGMKDRMKECYKQESTCLVQK